MRYIAHWLIAKPFLVAAALQKWPKCLSFDWIPLTPYFKLGLRPIFGLCLLAFPFLSEASPLEDFYINQATDRYFSLPQDARSLAMGGSSALTCQSSACLFLNPAGLGRVRQLEFSAALGGESVSGGEFINEEDIEQSLQQGYGILGISLGAVENSLPRQGTLAIAYSRYLGNTDDSVDTTPDGHRRSLGYGLAIDPSVSFGYSFTFYDDELRNNLASLHSHARFLHIFGAQFHPSEDLIVAGIFKLGLGQSDTFDETFGSDGLSHLKEYTGALAVTKRWDKFGVSMGVDYSRYESDGNLKDVNPLVVFGGDEGGHSYNIRLGAEASILNNLSLLTGMRWHRIQYEFSRSELEDISGRLHNFGLSGGLQYVFDPPEDDKVAPHIELGIEYLATTKGEWRTLLSFTLPIFLSL